MGKSSLSFTACILALLCPFISPTPLDKGPAGQAPQVEPRDVVTVTRHVVNSIVQSNPPFYNTACKAGGCTFSYESVSLFYWPTAAPNTACLSTLPSPPIQTPPPGLLLETNSVYVIFTSMYLHDSCNTKLLEANFHLTTSFAPDQLSTVATTTISPGPAGTPISTLTTAVFNFADLPCGPQPGVQTGANNDGRQNDNGQPYRPLLAPPPFVTEIPGWNHAFDACDPGNGVDPPTALTTVMGGVPGPEVGGLPPRDVRVGVGVRKEARGAVRTGALVPG